MHHLIDAFNYVAFTLNRHRIATTLVSAFIFWAFAYTWYFRSLFGNYFKVTKPHSWRVDQVNKIAYSRGTRETQ